MCSTVDHVDIVWLYACLDEEGADSVSQSGLSPTAYVAETPAEFITRRGIGDAVKKLVEATKVAAPSLSWNDVSHVVRGRLGPDEFALQFFVRASLDPPQTRHAFICLRSKLHLRRSVDQRLEGERVSERHHRCFEAYCGTRSNMSYNIKCAVGACLCAVFWSVGRPWKTNTE